MTAPWSENMIAAALARQVFNNKALVVVPRCGWTGYECDLLVVNPDLRIIDVEIKISRSDFRADAKKDKWYHSWDWKTDGPWYGHDYQKQHRRPREFPRRVWKHFFAIPQDVWADDMLDDLPSPACGVILLRRGRDGRLLTSVRKAAKPCRDVDRLSPEQAVDIARLASLRMWDALKAEGGRR